MADAPCALCGGTRTVSRVTGYANSGTATLAEERPCPKCTPPCAGGKHPHMVPVRAKLVEGTPSMLHQAHQCPRCGTIAYTAVEATFARASPETIEPAAPGCPGTTGSAPQESG